MALTLYLKSNYTLEMYLRWQTHNFFARKSLHIETLNVRFLPVLIALSDMSCNTVHWSSFTIQFTKKRYVKRFLLMFLSYIFEIRMLLTKSQYKCLYAIYTRLQLSTATNTRLHVNATNMRLRILPTFMWAIIFLY